LIGHLTQSSNYAAAGNALYNNGNVLTQTITLPAAEKPSNAALPVCPDWGSNWCEQQFGYDNYGNRSMPQTSFTGLVAPQGFGAATNRITDSGWNYDAAGNVNQDAVSMLTYNYDGGNRLVAACAKAAAGRTLYGLTTYAYDASGQLSAEYGSTATATGTEYLTVDQLGTTRVVANASGTVLSRQDFRPFGDEIGGSTGLRQGVTGYGTDAAVSQKFTSKERDAESGLDFFESRYYSSAQGRFTSPDEFKGGFLDAFSGQAAFQPGPLPYADISDPQTLNKYAYVRNNPLRYTDPTGHCVEAVSCTLEFAGVGTFIGGPVGTVVGGLIGAGVGAFLGYEIGKAIINNLPGTPSQAPDINTGQIQKGVQPYDVGTAGDLRGDSVPGDRIDIHHVPQQQPAGQVISGYDPKTAPAIAVPEGEHRAIPRDTGTATRSPRDQLAKDVKDLRNNTNAPNGQIQKLIDLSKQKYPEIRKTNDQ
jgi:RHS repeat-associated protein